MPQGFRGKVGANQGNYSCQLCRPEGLLTPVTHLPSEPQRVCWNRCQNHSFVLQVSRYACCAPGSRLDVGNTQTEDMKHGLFNCARASDCPPCLQIPNSIHQGALLATVVSTHITPSVDPQHSGTLASLTHPAQFWHRAFAHHFSP